MTSHAAMEVRNKLVGSGCVASQRNETHTGLASPDICVRPAVESTLHTLYSQLFREALRGNHFPAADVLAHRPYMELAWSIQTSLYCIFAL